MPAKNEGWTVVKKKETPPKKKVEAKKEAPKKDAPKKDGDKPRGPRKDGDKPRGPRKDDGDKPRAAKPSGPNPKDAFKCYVKGIPASVSEAQLKSYFSAAGEIIDLYYKVAQEGTAWAFIGFPTEANLNAALKFNGEKIGDAEISVEKKDGFKKSRDAPVKTRAPRRDEGFKCYVKGFPASVSEADLKNYFSAAGEVTDCFYKVAADGFAWAFVGFSTEASLEAALKFHGEKIGDAELFVEKKDGYKRKN